VRAGCPSAGTTPPRASRRLILFPLLPSLSLSTCRNVENALQRHDRARKRWAVLPHHAAIAPKVRKVNLRVFCADSLQRKMVLVCTDRSSRGYDFEGAPVDHVVLYDLPRDADEYLRRVGRAGRAGRKGLATVLAADNQHRYATSLVRGDRLVALPNLGKDGKAVPPMVHVNADGAPLPLPPQAEEPKKKKGSHHKKKRNPNKGYTGNKRR